MRSLKILAIVAVLLLVGTVGALAQAREHATRVNLPNVSEGSLYYRSSLFPNVDGPPVSMPSPADPASVQSGPVANSTIQASSSMGKGLSGGLGLGAGALGAPGGSTFSSPKVRADREIRRLIRRLD